MKLQILSSYFPKRLRRNSSNSPPITKSVPKNPNMNMDLDPKEVLMHLVELGYCNITPQLLEEFINDLKKLIKYDTTKKTMVSQTHRTEDTTSSTLPNTTDESLSPSSPPTLQRKHRNHYQSDKASSKNEAGGSCGSSDSSVSSSRRVFLECTKLSTHKNLDKANVQKEKPVESYRLPPKSSKSCDCPWRRIGCKCCDENWTKEQQSIKTAIAKENLAPPRPKSSFIRTWQMPGQGRQGSATQRSDPVALYHHYQQMWKQQKLPGENNHSDLRWTIRERMLGQEPHPRPLSQASSVRSISRRHKRL